MKTRSIAQRWWSIVWKKVKKWVILWKTVVMLLYFWEDEYKTRVDTTRIESNTLSCNAVLDKKIKFCTHTTKHPGNTLPWRRGWSPEMLSYYKKMLSYYPEKRQCSTTTESKKTVLGSIGKTKTQYSKFYFDAREICNVVLFFGSIVARYGNVVLFFTKIRGR